MPFFRATPFPSRQHRRPLRHDLHRHILVAAVDGVMDRAATSLGYLMCRHAGGRLGSPRTATSTAMTPPPCARRRAAIGKTQIHTTARYLEVRHTQAQQNRRDSKTQHDPDRLRPAITQPPDHRRHKDHLGRQISDTGNRKHIDHKPKGYILMAATKPAPRHGLACNP